MRPFFLGTIIASLLFAGCAHYQLGTGARLTIKSIYVEPVENKSQLAQAREVVTAQLRQAFLRDGRIEIASSPESADASLRVTITDFRREVASPREGDTGLARKFNLTLGSSCTLRDNRSGQDLFAARIISAQREAFTDSGQPQSEYQAIPFLAETLAAKITRAVLDVW